ncbi:STAS/SEC14 domain-containing protein [Rufibacter tibetensis]|uniref:STAS/SEC14 domain-containing protein n=1 Tax=Rufibacter tibetensis TaxID=512763 RepID=A0A0P0CBT1_9BACT|nr:STAS/SEC14 domain-containing protein [Rufibacter tibetensis]ALI99134.1 hypothetical protein DC20_09305 [Rufibacter tibetensis]
MPIQLPFVYYQSHAFTIQYDEARSLGMAIWRGKFSKSDLQEAFLILIHVIDKYRLTRWLADDRKMKSMSEEERNWVFENVVPALLSGPLRRMAILPSEDAKQVEDIDHLVERAGDLGDFALRNFGSEEEALEWLMQE